MTHTAVAQPRRQAWSARLRDLGFWAEWAALIGLIVLIIVFQSLNSTFLTIGNIESMLLAASILIVLAVGQTFVISTAGIDLSVASMMTLGAVAFGQTYAAGWSLWLCFIAAVVAAGFIGVLNGIAVAFGKIADFIVTLGALSAASGLALIFADGKPVTIVNPSLLELSTGGISFGNQFQLGWPFLIAALVALIAHGTLFHTRFGTHVLATGGSPESSRAMGISTQRVKIAVYSISGILAGLAAILLVARIGAAEPASNTSFLLNSVAAVVLGGVNLFGGRATIIGPVLGALLLTALVNGLTLLGVSQFYQPLAVGIVVVLAAFLTRFRR